jgi:hypothetical protein
MTTHSNSYGDNVVALASSTMNDIVLHHRNLAIGVYVPQMFVTSYTKNILILLVILYVKGRNLGMTWDVKFVSTKRSAT